MKQRTYIAIILALTISSCHSTKSVTESTVTTKDSSTTHKEHKVSSNDSSAYVSQTEDTAIGIKGKHLTGIFTPEDLTPAKLDNGKKVERNHRIEGDGISIGVNVDTNGNTTIDCKTDSITLVVQKLKKELIYIAHQRDSVTKELNKQLHSVEAVTKSKKKVKNIIGAWWTYLIFLGVGAVLWWLLKIAWKAVKTYFGR